MQHKILALIGWLLTLVYSVFMLLFLKDVNKKNSSLNKRDKSFGKTAYVITWIEVVCVSLLILVFLFSKGRYPYSVY